MSQFMEQIRHVCALGGLQSIVAINRAVPIVHAGPGCVRKLTAAVGMNNGSQGAGYLGGLTIPCTNIGEKEVIFGGAEKLKSTIENALKIMDADFFAVVSGCTPEIVGDDIGEVVRIFQAEGKPVVYAETGGFNGTNYNGHELVVNAIIDQYLKPVTDKTNGLVNIWSTVPYQDPFWVGNLKEIEKLLLELGLIPNIIFGPGSGRGIAALNQIPRAQFNLLISPWVGLKNVQHLEEKFGTPYLHYATLPIGPTETGNFLRAVGSFAGVESQLVERVIEKHETDYYYYIERIMEVLYETRILPRRFVTVADSFYALAVAKFLVNDLGLIPETQFITDGVSPEDQEAVTNEFKFNEGIKANVVFEEDGGLIHEKIRTSKFKSRILIIGSTWEKVLAGEINAFQLSVAPPVSDKLVLNSFYVGYDGALKLLEDIYTAIIADTQPVQ